MNLLPKSKEDFSQKEYWNSFFAKRGKKAFEWYGEYPELCEQIHKYVKVKDDILIIGCGNSNLSMDMYDIGFNKITNIDISKVVIRQMNDVNSKKRPDMSFLQMDVMNMSFQDESFSVIIDKGTLDALMPNSDPETDKQITKMFQEIQRVLKCSGRYICISLLQEHILKKLLDYFPKENWMLRVVRCHDVEKKTKENGENSLPVFLVVCTKFKQLPTMILETCLAGTSFHRHPTFDDLANTVGSVQQAALVCSGLQRGSGALQNDSEIMLELQDPKTEQTRYTVYVQEGKGKQVYAAFIVPQGRETEWLFATKEGRRNLLKSANFSRLAIVTLHRGQIYNSLDSVKEELSSTILSLAPPNIPKSIPYLSLGEDVGQREIKFEGRSEFSGNFVIEDVTNNEGEIYRRLIFLNNQNVIQSEAKLKKTKSGYHPDHLYLSCAHHCFMSLGVSTLTPQSSVVLVGVGGGGLCNFLVRVMPQITTTAVDIDSEVLQVAKKWFGLQESQNLKIVLGDGLEFIKTNVEDGKKYNAILFDVDSKDASLGMSCPPKEFLEENILNNVKTLIGNEGIFILNLVLRDETLRPSIISKLKTIFTSVISYKLEEDLNEILYCKNKKLNSEQWKNELKTAAEQLNATIKKKKIQKNNFIDINSLLENLS